MEVVIKVVYKLKKKLLRFFVVNFQFGPKVLILAHKSKIDKTNESLVKHRNFVKKKSVKNKNFS